MHLFGASLVSRPSRIRHPRVCRKEASVPGRGCLGTNAGQQGGEGCHIVQLEAAAPAPMMRSRSTGIRVRLGEDGEFDIHLSQEWGGEIAQVILLLEARSPCRLEEDAQPCTAVAGYARVRRRASSTWTRRSSSCTSRRRDALGAYWGGPTAPSTSAQPRDDVRDAVIGLFWCGRPLSGRLPFRRARRCVGLLEDVDVTALSARAQCGARPRSSSTALHTDCVCASA